MNGIYQRTDMVVYKLAVDFARSRKDLGLNNIKDLDI